MPDLLTRRDRFLLCRRCGLLMPLALPGFTPALDRDDAAELAAFQAAHEAHGIEIAERTAERATADRPLWDPMVTRWFTVAAGSDTLTVRSWRADADLPRRYELATAGPPALNVWVDVDEPLLRRALDRHFFPHVLREVQRDAVVAAVRALVTPLDPDEVDIAFDDTALPDTGIGPFPPACAARLLAVCREVFDPVSFERADSFIRAHSGPDGALAVRVHRAPTPRAA